MGASLDLGEFSHGHDPAADERLARQQSTNGGGPAHPYRTLRRPHWQIRYARAVIAADLVAMTVSIGLHEWWGQAANFSSLSVVLGLVLLVMTVVALGLSGAWDPPSLGQGSEEFSRILRALVTVAVILALVGLVFKLPDVRPWVFGVVPVGGILAAIGRLALRKALHRRRRSGTCMHEVLAVGAEDAVAAIITRTQRAGHYGWVVTAACTPTGRGTDGSDSILGVPVVGDLDSVTEIAGKGRHRVVSIAQIGWSSRRLHHLAWDLEGTGTELVVDPGLMEIAGPRLHMAAVDGMPLLRLTEPTFTGLPRLIKTVGDRLVAGLLLLLVAPVLAGLAIAVACDGGPVLFLQSRIGRHGKQFCIVKFRSMERDAEARRGELEASNEADGPVFKLYEDPRVTKVGTYLRRYSLDELPQLFNVLAGSMSLVGPRPPLPGEIARYSRDAQRKLLVKPGLTGLWQISGRSDLSWEESVRLDLRYVENWSLALDALIVWKTVGAVVRGTGAY